MKRKFSISWKSSKQPRKQRKYLANAPLHLKKKLLSSNLSKELRKKHGRRSFPLRKGDTIKIFRGKFKNKEGKVLKVDLKRQRVEIQGIQIKKQDGSKVNVGLIPSKLQIIELNLEDKKRNSSLKKIEKESPKTTSEEIKKEKPEVKKTSLKNKKIKSETKKIGNKQNAS